MGKFYTKILWFSIPFLVGCNWSETSNDYEPLDYGEPPKIEENEELDKISNTANELENNNFADKDVNDFMEDYTQFLKDYVEAEKKGDKEKMKELASKSNDLKDKMVKMGEKFSKEDKENNVPKKKVIASEYPVSIEIKE